MRWQCSRQARSMHGGSGRGVSGASGMQVQPFLPWRRVVALPPASIVTIEASWAIDAGAADSALAIGSPGAAALVDANAALPFAEASLVDPGLLQAPVAATATAAVSHKQRFFMSPPHIRGRTSTVPRFNSARTELDAG